MTSKGTTRIFVLSALSVSLFACSGAQVSYPPPANPFLSGAPALEKTTLAQPTKAVLVWLEAQGTTAPTAGNFDATATPQALSSKSQAMMEKVMIIPSVR